MCIVVTRTLQMLLFLVCPMDLLKVVRRFQVLSENLTCVLELSPEASGKVHLVS